MIIFYVSFDVLMAELSVDSMEKLLRLFCSLMCLVVINLQK